jgi:UMF1 family MFS transporter
MNSLAEAKQHNRIINAWCLYDVANSAFYTTIVAAVLPTFYASVAAKHLPGNVATAYWGYTNTIALLLVALAAPIMGAIADYTGSKKRFLAAFAAMGIFFTSLLVFVGSGDWLLASILFILGEVGCASSIIFYDALLPHIAGPGEIDRVSTKGYALGYLGGGVLLAINLAWILSPKLFGLPDATVASQLSFLSVGLWWAIFTIPLLRIVPEPPADKRGVFINPVMAAFGRLRHTIRDIRKYREMFKFLVAFWLYNDGIGTIIKMATIYGAEIGIGQTDLIGALLLTQFVGIPFSFLFGRLAGRLGTKRSILLALGVYTIISILGYFMTQAWHFWALALLVGTVQGGSQALSRSLFGVMSPKAKTGEFFGFYDVSSKFAGILGPTLFAVVGQLAGSSRLSIVSLVVFFVVGGYLLSQVNEDEGIRRARAEDAEQAQA